MAGSKTPQEQTVETLEQTIREAISFSGVGLHSGASVKMRILPARVGTGICFRRVDLDGFSIEAVGRNVAKVSYATSLMKRGVLISTTEHALSALMGFPLLLSSGSAVLGVTVSSVVGIISGLWPAWKPGVPSRRERA